MAYFPVGEFCQVCLTAAPDVPFVVTITLAEFDCSIAKLVSTVCGIKLSDHGNSTKVICGTCLKDLSNTLRERLLNNERISQENSLNGDFGEQSIIKCEPGLRHEHSKDNERTGRHRVSNTDSQNMKHQRKKKCFKCRQVFANKYLLIEHLRHHQRPIHQCRDCFKKFKRPEQLMKHIHFNHNGRNAFETR